VLVAKGPRSWWVMCAPGGVDRALGLCVWGEQCTTKKSSCVNACVMTILPGTAYEVKTTLDLRLSVVNVRQSEAKNWQKNHKTMTNHVM
jgi:hypothetical protein